MINIYLLGRFEMILDDGKPFPLWEIPKKGRLLLQYLLLKNEVANYAELCEILWPEGSSKNPERTLKALVSKTRVALGQFDERLGKCIETIHRGGYRWNNALDGMVDVRIFEKRCQQLLTGNDESLPTDYFEDVLGMYVGDLKYDSKGGSWFIARSLFYHSLYLQLAAHAADSLRKQNHWEGIIRICRRALDIDAFDETLHLELMNALVQTDQTKEALVHCRYADSLYQNYLGAPLPERIKSFNSQIIRANSTLSVSMQEPDLRQKLQAPLGKKKPCGELSQESDEEI
jgi:DNA-binding SARP family transcriptional activator